MTPNEFKAWFDGFCEGVDGRPTKEQWEKIVLRVKDLAEHKAIQYRMGTGATERINDWTVIGRTDAFTMDGAWRGAGDAGEEGDIFFDVLGDLAPAFERDPSAVFPDMSKIAKRK